MAKNITHLKTNDEITLNATRTRKIKYKFSSFCCSACIRALINLDRCVGINLSVASIVDARHAPYNPS